MEGCDHTHTRRHVSPNPAGSSSIYPGAFRVSARGERVAGGIWLNDFDHLQFSIVGTDLHRPGVVHVAQSRRAVFVAGSLGNPGAIRLLSINPREEIERTE